MYYIRMQSSTREGEPISPAGPASKRGPVSLRLHASLSSRIEKLMEVSGMTKSGIIVHLIGVGLPSLEKQHERKS